MKILQLIPNLSGGGAERFCVDLCNALAQEHQVCLATLYAPRKEDVFRNDLKPEITTFSLDKKLGFDYRVFEKLYKIIKTVNPDVIHTHLRVYNYLLPVLPLCKKIPVVHTVHNDAFKECPNPKIRRIRGISFKRQHIIPVTISNESSTSFKKAYPSITYTQINNGRQFPQKSSQFEKVCKEVEAYKINKETKVFVNIGRQEVQKNQLILVEAFNQLIKEESANAILLIIGGGRNSDKSFEIQKKLKLEAQENPLIHVLGEKVNATDYLHVSDYFCLSSLFEGMPITLIEAFATSCIPVCTPVGGVSEMVSELDRDLLSKDTNPKGYYKTLKRAYKLSDEEQIRINVRAIKLFKEKYSMENCSMNYNALYKRVKTK